MTEVERKYAMKYLVGRCHYLETVNGLEYVDLRKREPYISRNKCIMIDQTIALNVTARMGLLTSRDFALVEWSNTRNI